MEPIRVCKSLANTTDAARWYALQTHALQEDRAAENLNAWGVETFVPKYKERRSNAFTGRPIYFTRSLFPRYMFARFDAARMLRKVWFTRGVAKVVGFGDGPMTNLVGVFERDLEDGDRVLMLLTTISHQGHVTIERELLKKIS